MPSSHDSSVQLLRLVRVISDLLGLTPAQRTLLMHATADQLTSVLHAAILEFADIINADNT